MCRGFSEKEGDWLEKVDIFWAPQSSNLEALYQGVI